MTLPATEDLRILQARAAELAKPRRSEAAADFIELVVFRLGPETFGIESDRVHAVFRLTDIAAVPRAPAPIHGVTLWRGEIVPVLDLRAALGISTTALNDLVRVIALGAARPEVGVLADKVEGIRRIDRRELHPPARATEDTREGYVTAVSSDAVLVLDANKLAQLAGGGTEK